MMLDMEIITESLPLFRDGLILTIELVLNSLLCGLMLALPLSVLRVSSSPWLAKPVRAYTYFFCGTPMLVQLMMIYYGLGQLQWMQDQWQGGNAFWLLFREPYFCAVLAFTLNTGAYTTEILAGAIKNTARGDIEAAQALGMTRAMTLWHIVLPSAIRRSIPAYSNEAILVLQGSSIASAVTLVELTGAGKTVYTKYYAPFEGYITCGIIYLALTFCMLALFRQAERIWLVHLKPRKA